MVFIILIKDNKIISWKTPIISLEDKPKLIAADLKACFDSNSNELKDSLNGVIDTLTSKTGADNIGITQIDNTDGNTVQQALQNLSDKLTKVDPYLGNPVSITQGGTGAKTAGEALYNLGAKPNDNLLDNWYFIGGGNQLGGEVFPINQKGLTTYLAGRNTFDRWSCDGNVCIQSDFVVFNNTFYQYVPWNKIKSLLGKTLTMTILYSDNTLRSGVIKLKSTYIESTIEQSSDPILQMFIDPNNPSQIFRHVDSAYVKALKIELGENQTLARQLEDGSWEPLEKPDYTSELLKCQKYFYKSSQQIYVSGYTYNSIVNLSIPLPTQMRIANPTCDISGFIIPNLGEIKNVIWTSGANNGYLNISVPIAMPDTLSVTAQIVTLLVSAEI